MTQPARRPRTIAPAVLLWPSVDSEAGSPEASPVRGVAGTGAGAGSGAGEPCGKSPPWDPPGGFVASAPPPEGVPDPPASPLSPASNSSRYSSGDLPEPGGTAVDGGTPPAGGLAVAPCGSEPPCDDGFLEGFGSRGGAEIGRWEPERGTRASAVTQTGEASWSGAWRK